MADEVICATCGSNKVHALARIGGIPYCGSCFGWKMNVNIQIARNPRYGTLLRWSDLMGLTSRLELAAAAIAENDSDRDRKELAADILADVRSHIGRHIPHAEREYYTLAQSLLLANLQMPRVCCQCGRSWKPDDPKWDYWDLCGDDECCARDVGLRIVGEEE